mmetsp:Transcript_12599/g.26520  ORF Transcript_12599/g.26520 Transcript_12599/m.26520 type:complete len:280 (-) Transcript_12599:406-1245(-)
MVLACWRDRGKNLGAFPRWALPNCFGPPLRQFPAASGIRRLLCTAIPKSRCASFLRQSSSLLLLLFCRHYYLLPLPLKHRSWLWVPGSERYRHPWILYQRLPRLLPLHPRSRSRQQQWGFRFVHRYKSPRRRRVLHPWCERPGCRPRGFHLSDKQRQRLLPPLLRRLLLLLFLRQQRLPPPLQSRRLPPPFLRQHSRLPPPFLPRSPLQYRSQLRPLRLPPILGQSLPLFPRSLQDLRSRLPRRSCSCSRPSFRVCCRRRFRRVGSSKQERRRTDRQYS